MDFQLTSEQRILIDSASRFTTNEIGLPGSRRDLSEGITSEMLRRYAEAGFAGIALPETDGGQGGGLFDSVLVLEAVAQLNPIAGDCIQALNFGALRQIAHIGSDGIKEAFLKPLLSGDALVAIAMTEPEAGSALDQMKTTAAIDGEVVIINGQKIFTTHGPTADYFVVWARFGPAGDTYGAVIVDRETAGFTVDSSGSFLSGEHYGMLFFEDCLVPRSNVLIDSNGFRPMFSVFNIERLGNATRSLALGEAAYEIALDHSTSRVQGEKRLSDHQGIQWRLAEMATTLASARLLLYKAAVEADQGLPSETNTAMAKLACNRAGYDAADAALQILGGHGYDGDSVVGYLFERTRGWKIAGGAVELMLNRIARGILKDRL